MVWFINYIQMCGGFSPSPSNSKHQLSVLQFNSILTLSTGDCIRSHRLRAQSCKTATPLQMSILNPGCHLCLWPTGCRLVVPMIPSLGLINLLEWLTEIRKTFYSLDYWLIIKGYTSGQPYGRHGTRKRCRDSMLSLGLHLHVFPHSEALQTCTFGFLWKLRYIGMID